MQLSIDTDAFILRIFLLVLLVFPFLCILLLVVAIWTRTRLQLSGERSPTPVLGPQTRPTQTPITRPRNTANMEPQQPEMHPAPEQVRAPPYIPFRNRRMMPGGTGPVYPYHPRGPAMPPRYPAINLMNERLARRPRKGPLGNQGHNIRECTHGLPK